MSDPTPNITGLGGLHAIQATHQQQADHMGALIAYIERCSVVEPVPKEVEEALWALHWKGKR